MKKTPLFALVVISILSMILFTAGGPGAAKLATLVDTRFVYGKGVVFIFDLTGKFKASDLKGAYVKIGAKKVPLDCSLNDWGQAACTSSGMGENSGKSVTGGFAGFWFTSSIPESHGNICLGHGFTTTGVHPKEGYKFDSYVILPENRPIQHWLYPGEKVTSKISCITVKWPGYPDPYYKETP